MNFNLFNLISAIGPTIQAIQFIHSGEPGATKKTKALQWLGLGEAIVGQGNPALGDALQKATVSVSNIIDEMVALFHATGQPGFGTTSVPALPPTVPTK